MLPVGRDRGGERDLSHLGHELAESALAADLQGTVGDVDVETAAAERRHEHHVARLLGEVDGAPAPGDAIGEPRHVHVPSPIALRDSEEHRIEPAAVDEVERGHVIDERFPVDRRPERRSARRDTPDDARVDGHGHQVLRVLLADDTADQLGETDAEVDNVVGAELERRPTGDHRATVDGKPVTRPQRNAQLPGQCRVVPNPPGLLVLVQIGHDDGVDEDGRDADIPRVERPCFGDPLHLADHVTAARLGGHGELEDLEIHGLALGGDVAGGIGRGAANDRHVDRKPPVEQPLFVAARRELHEVVDRGAVHLAALDPRVDERSDADGGQQTR